MSKWEEFGLHDFLVQHHGLRLKEISPEKLVIEGTHEFDAEMDGFQRVSDTVNLRLVFPGNYPKELPKVYELGDKIPKDANHHINPDERNFCLGSSIRVLEVISRDTSLTAFLKNCVNNFLYRVFHKIRFSHIPIPGGELKHGENGLIQDYESIFGIEGKSNVILLLKALSSRKRVANKLLCPCACGRRLGKCSFRLRLIEWRKKGKRQWYRDHLKNSFTNSQPKAKRRNRKKTKPYSGESLPLTPITG